MKIHPFICLFFILSSCRSFDSKVLGEPKYSGCTEYGTDIEIPPKVLRLGDYTFVFSCGALGAFHLDKELFYQNSGDGFYDTVYLANFNNDGIPDFITSYSMEDFSVLDALISQSKDSFLGKELGDPMDGHIYCLLGQDTMDHLDYIAIDDINNDNKDEVLINTAVIHDKRIGFYCSDTLFVEQ